jgi:hypothetical protein
MDIRNSNYYDLLELKYNCTKNDVIKSYKMKISKFDGLPFLTSKMINEVKQYKIALYILSNDTRRNKYNKLINQSINNDIENDYIDNVNKKLNDRLFAGIF